MLLDLGFLGLGVGIRDIYRDREITNRVPCAKRYGSGKPRCPGSTSQSAGF